MNTLTLGTAISTGRVELVNTRQRSLFTARFRTLWIVALFAAVALVALLRIAFLGIVQPSAGPTSMAEALLPPRGEITDRNGVPLALAFPAYALWYNPQALGDGGAPLVRSAKAVAARLAAIFPDMDEAELARRLASGKAGYLRRRVLPEEANQVNDIGEIALELPRETDRHYPQGSMAAHVLGFVDSDGKGRLGMEEVLNARLLDPAQRGTPAALSIDLRVQGALEDELQRGMLSVDAAGAAGIVLDVDTGEVLALASLPSFDPNHVVPEDLKLPKARSDLGELPRAFNRATNQVYELGSTFKPLTVAAAIDAGVITDLSRRYPADRPLQVSGYPIRDSHVIGASLNVPEALIHSSNIVTAQVADELGTKALQRTLEDLGMHKRPEIELPGRGRPLWQKGEWPRLTTMTVGYGHGLSVTPLHLATAYATMVNGGIWRPATLFRLKPGAAPSGHRVFKASTSARMNQLLRMITLYGTGRNADAPGFRIGGKTGSAEKPSVGGYNRTALVSTFASAFPMDRPRFVVVIMLDEPKGTVASSGNRTAAWNAAPIVGRLVPRIGPMLGIMPDDTRDIDISDLRPLVEGPKKESEG